MKIEVTQENINKGGHNCRCCPLQRAIKEHTTKTVFAYSFGLAIEVLYDKYPTTTLMWSPKILEWLGKYDNLRKPVEPLTFNLSAECFVL